MAIIGKRIVPRALPLEVPQPAKDGQQVQDRLRTRAHQQLGETFQACPRIPFDHSSRFVFFSDCHRGNNGRTDAFAPNKELFHHALAYYYELGFTYCEVGDGDELWMNPRFSDVQLAHQPVFDMLHRFNQNGRLHLILGNHDVPSRQKEPLVKDGIATQEGLVLQHATSGQQILVVHGHQADFGNDPDFAMSRFVVRHFWRRLQMMGFGTMPVWADPTSVRSWLERQILGRLQAHKRKVEQRIVAWLQAWQKTVICGHTHLAHFAARGSPPYFNAGSCLIPGQITGLEIQDGQISMVKWSHGTNGSRFKRELVAPARKLSLVC